MPEFDCDFISPACMVSYNGQCKHNTKCTGTEYGVVFPIMPIVTRQELQDK